MCHNILLCRLDLFRIFFPLLLSFVTFAHEHREPQIRRGKREREWGGREAEKPFYVKTRKATELDWILHHAYSNRLNVIKLPRVEREKNVDCQFTTGWPVWPNMKSMKIHAEKNTFKFRLRHLFFAFPHYFLSSLCLFSFLFAVLRFTESL